MNTSLLVASLLAAFSPEEADRYASEVGRPLPSVVRLEHPVFSTIEYGAGQEPFTIFLNRHGGRYTCGDEDSSSNSSGIACGASPADVGAWPGSDADWASFMGCAVDLFSRFNLTITDVEPASGDYVEAVVGGSPGDVGMGGGVGGVAPYQCGVIPRAIVYAFADVYYGSGSWWRDVCETAAQEIVHAFGLDHEYLCEDPMTYLYGCGEKTFQDTDAQCGEYSPRQCDCTGSSQNSVQEMLDLFGPAGPPVDDPQPPLVSLVSPAAGAVLAANSEIQIRASASDDLGIRSVVLEWDFNGDRMACPGSGEHFSCAQSGTSYTWSIRVGEGARTYRVRATDLGQNAVATADRTITLAVGGGDGGGTDPPPEGDVQPPSLRIDEPAADAVLPANQPLQVSATITDDVGVASAELFWDFSGDAYPCPLTSEYVVCAVSGASYTWSLSVGAGSRTFHVRATDAAGNTASTPARTIELAEGGAGGGGDTDDTDPGELPEPVVDAPGVEVVGGCACAQGRGPSAPGAPWSTLLLGLSVAALAPRGTRRLRSTRWLLGRP